MSKFLHENWNAWLLAGMCFNERLEKPTRVPSWFVANLLKCFWKRKPTIQHRIMSSKCQIYGSTHLLVASIKTGIGSRLIQATSTWSISWIACNSCSLTSHPMVKTDDVCRHTFHSQLVPVKNVSKSHTVLGKSHVSIFVANQQNLWSLRQLLWKLV